MIVLVPSAPALLPAYGSLEDPLPDLRAACREAVAELVAEAPERVAVVAAGPRPDNVGRGVGTSAGVRIAEHLLAEAGYAGAVVSFERGLPLERGTLEAAVLVVGNGSARRTENAPGHLDVRALPFDDELDAALRSADGATLRGTDLALAEELWCHDAPAFHVLGELLEEQPPGEVEVGYDGDPFGVRYWVVTWR